MKGTKAWKIFVIAGEVSGDILGEKILSSLPEVLPSCTIEGIGGPLMERAGGFSSIFPFHTLSSMGFWHIVRQLPRFIGMIMELRKKLRESPPDLLLTIDSPQFCLRMGKWLGQKMPHIPRIHCVSPAFWAWRPQRANHMHRYTDHVLALFPFEKAFYKTVPCTFVGHPVADYPLGKAEKMWKKYPDYCESPFLCVLPGSRPQEIAMSIPIFEKTVDLLKKSVPHLHVAMIVPSFFALQHPSFPCIHNVAKEDVFSAATAAVTVSGTVTLELAHQCTPMVITYKTSRFTAWLARNFAHVRHCGLVNILKGKEVSPECLQEKFSPEDLTRQLLPLLQKKESWRRQKKELKNVTRMLRGEKPFGRMCAEVIASYLQ